MRIVDRVGDLRQVVASWHRAGQRVALVPTMGNLHAGHLALVRAAAEIADRMVVSIFVNPMQFGAGEDFDAYPRTFEEDKSRLIEGGVDLLFAPSAATVYPTGAEQRTRVEVPGLSDILCGASRPGHFVGVATVVCKLFNMVQPDLAVFGEKDFQQLLVIRRMGEDLNFPVEILGQPIVREADGLAMSSRNGYLSPEQRAAAPLLYRTLQAAAQAIRNGERDYGALQVDAQRTLREGGFRPDYFSVRRAGDLQPAGAASNGLVILAAAYLGSTRLIDNMQIQ
jgi:pantoate--beta-alanine ligase